VAKFKYLGTTVTKQNVIREEIGSRLNSGNACYHSIQNIVSFPLLCKNVKIKIYRNINLPGCETWSLDIKGRTQLERISEKGVEENICTKEG
jgi:hypothetical protein